MGVPGFYKWLVQRYPLIRRRLNDVPKPKIDNLYIDFNCIIYNSLQNVLSTEAPYTILFQEVCRFLDVLIQSIRPQCLVFIAVDGPAPFAKCTQQRARRFVSARDHVRGSFDTTQISVGTEFMELLHEFLLNYIKEKTSNDPVWQLPDIVYSPHRSPGEGEHKFFNFIRTNLNNGNITSNISHCIYSPDADLLFLGLQTRLPYFYILREWDGWIGPKERVGNGKLNKLKSTDLDFELINLHIVREFLQLDYPNIDDINKIIDDFATFSFLIGNDFIPHFPDVVIQSGQFTNVVQTYQRTIMGKKFIVENGKINKKTLKEFLTAYIVSYHDNARGMTIKTEKEAREYLKEKYPEEFDRDPNQLEQKLAYAVLDSFEWVFDYYTKGCQSWNWCFPYLYPPPLILVAKHCETHKSHYTMDRPPTPFEQLLCIEPPQSYNLLPKAAQHLMFKPSLIEKYYPSSFTIDLNGRKFEHEGVVLIPMINLNEIRSELAKTEHEFTEEEKKRNTIIDDFLIKKGSLQIYNENDITLLKEKAKNADVPPYTPSLYDSNIQFTYSSEKLKVSIFNTDSFSSSIFIHFAYEAYEVQPPSKTSDLKYLLNKPILINWPYLKPALVSAIIDRNHDYLPENLQIKKKDEIDSIFEKVEYFYKRKLALDASNAKVLLAVHPIIATSIEHNRFRFEEVPVFVPYIFTTSIHKAPNFLTFFNRIKPPKLTSGMAVVVKSGKNQGRVGKVQDVSDDGLKATVVLEHQNNHEEFEQMIKDDDKEWEPIDSIVGLYKTNFEKALKLLTSITMEVVNYKEVDVAFTAFSKNKVLEGYCRHINDETDEKGFHEVTKDFIAALGDYIQIPQLQPLLSMIQNDRIKSIGKILLSKILSQSDFDSSGQRAAEIQEYLKNQPCKKNFLIDDHIVTISQKTLMKMEEKLINFTENNENEVVEESLDNLLWPEKPKEIDQNFKIGTRVVVLNASGSIPFGATGTVVAFDRINLLFSVLLDKEFPFACNLRKRLQTNRGLVAKIDDLFFL